MTKHFTHDCEEPCCTYCGSTDATSNAGKNDDFSERESGARTSRRIL